MKSLRFYLLLLTFGLIFSSCEKEDAAALAKNKALKEKVALEMKKAMEEADEKKPKTKTAKKIAKKSVKKPKPKVDPTLANRPNQRPKPETDLAKEKLEPVVKKTPNTKKAAEKKAVSKKKQKTLRPAVIQIITNFEEADATVNGIPYPEYVPQGEEPGMILPAGGPYAVEVTGANARSYEIYLKPNETRLLFVSNTGGSVAKPKKKVTKKPEKKEKKKEEEKKADEKKSPGKVTIYGKPPGTILVDGVSTGEKTPGTIEMKNGRHEVQIKYDESGEISEKKIVRVRDNSKIKLFFRERKK